MTRKTQFCLSAAGAVLGLAVITAVWLTRGSTPPPDDTPPTPPAVADSPQPEQPQDPQVLAEIRAAYQKSLAESAPPGMTQMTQGSGAGAARPGELPPLRDPFVTPTGYHPEAGASAELPPLPPVPAKKPEVPPPDKSAKPAATPKEKTASDELPPLPPVDPH